MLKDDEKSLYGEIKAAEEERDQHLRHFKKMVQRSHGKAYKAPGSLSHGSTLENHYHEYVSHAAASGDQQPEGAGDEPGRLSDGVDGRDP